uniref:hypothetical protein n=1 Tax=Bacteroides congonensis TaxID=1871006 RepID=UPI00264A43EB
YSSIYETLYIAALNEQHTFLIRLFSYPAGNFPPAKEFYIHFYKLTKLCTAMGMWYAVSCYF